MVTTDFLVIGGGVIGISIARGLKKLYTDSTVTVIEKEDECGLHASGRNSGVLHAGFYYSPDSLKAQFTRLGNKLLTEYCESKGIPLNKCGKLVVAREPGDHISLDELRKRGQENGIDLEDVTEKEAKLIEPRVKTCERALFSPTTATVNPMNVIRAMKEDAIREGVRVCCGVAYIRKCKEDVVTGSGTYHAGYVVTAAGLYADKIARDWGFSERYRIVPFKGLYLYSNEQSGAVRTIIYPVPDLKNPFLGVHVTVTAERRIKIGPTAIPTFWREQYSGLANFKFSEFVDLALRQASFLVWSNFNYKTLALQEIRKYFRRHLITLAASLMEGVKEEDYTTWGKPGIRAQLVDIRSRKLEMDFVLEGDEKSMHVLNAVSPAFTCAIPFSEYVCKRIEEKIGPKSREGGFEKVRA